MIVWPANEEQESDDEEEEDGAQPVGPVPDNAQRRQDDGDREHDELEPEAAEARAALGLQLFALVLDGPGEVTACNSTGPRLSAAAPPLSRRKTPRRS